MLSIFVHNKSCYKTQEEKINYLSFQRPLDLVMFAIIKWFVSIMTEFYDRFSLVTLLWNLFNFHVSLRCAKVIFKNMMISRTSYLEQNCEFDFQTNIETTVTTLSWTTWYPYKNIYFFCTVRCIVIYSYLNQSLLVLILFL